MTDLELFSIEATLETKPENPTWAQYLRVVRHCLRLRADLRQRHTVEVFDGCQSICEHRRCPYL